MKLAALFAPLAIALVFASGYFFGVPEFASRIFQPSATPPRADDYRVYSAFVDDFISQRPFPMGAATHETRLVLVLGETIPERQQSQLDVAVLGAEGTWEDFLLENSESWPLQAKAFRSRFNVQLVGRGASINSFSQLADGTEGILEVSRPGFNRAHSKALLYYSLNCGNLCGRSGLVLLTKNAGHWHIAQFGPATVS